MRESYYLFSSGTLKREGNTVCIINKNKEKRFVPVEKVESLSIFGSVDFNSKLLEFLSTQGITLHIFGHEENYVGTFYPRDKNISGCLRIKQVEYATDEQKRLYIATQIVHASIHNMVRVISPYAANMDLSDHLTSLKTFREEASLAKNIEQLMGIEGNARRIYYDTLSLITGSDFKGRQKHPPKGQLNALISFGNSLLYTETINRIYQTQLDPSISYLHEPMQSRFSLSLDISEMFKPVIVDRTIITLLNKHILSDNDFDETFDRTYLNEDGKKKFIQQYDTRIKNTVYHPRLKRKVSYRTLIEMECYKLSKHLLGMQDYQGFKIWW